MASLTITSDPQDDVAQQTPSEIHPGNNHLHLLPTAEEYMRCGLEWIAEQWKTCREKKVVEKTNGKE